MFYIRLVSAIFSFSLSLAWCYGVVEEVTTHNYIKNKPWGNTSRKFSTKWLAVCIVHILILWATSIQLMIR